MSLTGGNDQSVEQGGGPSLVRRLLRGVGWFVIGLVVLILLLAGGIAWYTTTHDFQRRAASEIVKVLEDSTGGRVEIHGMSFDLRHLAVEVDGLVIHGLEGPGEAPYLAADGIQLRLKLFSFFQHTTGTGLASHVSLNYLRVDRPSLHLIVYPDGKTNQPVPKHPSNSKTPLTDTLLDLKAKQAELANGIALLNDRAIPFDLAANDLNVVVHYLPGLDMYGATIDLRNLQTKMKAEPVALSSLHLDLALGRDKAELKQLLFHTGADSQLQASGRIDHFSAPVWQVKVDGSLALQQVSVLSGFDGLTAGIIDLEINGHSCNTAPAVAQKHPRFWQRLHPPKATRPSTKILPPDPDCQAGYLMVGTAKLHNAGYRDQYVRLHGVNGGAQLHITPTELLFTALTGYLPDGGSAEGQLRISNWLGEAPANAGVKSPTTQAAVSTTNKTAKSVGAQVAVSGPTTQPVVPAQAYLDVTISKISLRTIMDVTAPEHYGDLGFDTAIDGPVKVQWGGPAKFIADTVQVDADLRLAPTGVKRKGALSDVPVTGQVLGHYDGKTETVAIQKLTFHTLQSTLDASGTLGVNEGDRLTALRTDLVVRDLGEYDQLLQTLGFSANGKKGRAAIPIVLHGAMQFHGTASGEIQDLNVKGHLLATDLEAQLGTAQDIHIDTLVADGEYSPFSGVAVANSTISQGTAVLNVQGSFRPHKMISRKHVATYVWDSQSQVNASAQIANAQMSDMLTIAGEQKKVPVTGTLNLNAHAVGTIKSFQASGHVSLTKGIAYGEPYDSLAADLALHGNDAEASNLVLVADGAKLTGNGGYDTASEHIHGHLETNRLVLSKIKTLQEKNPGLDGVLSFVADADGTVKQPALKAKLQLTSLSYEKQALGQLSADLHTEGETAYLTMQSTLVDTKVDLAGNVKLDGNYQAQAKLTFSGLDLNKPLAIFAANKVTAQSALSGVVTLTGPLNLPQQISGQAELDNVDVKLQGVELKSAAPVRVGLQQGTATLQPLHITGEDTDLHADGSVQILGSADPKGGRVDLHSTGSINLALLHTFDSSVLSSGKMDFTVAATGHAKNPSMSGKVQFDQANLAMDGVSNGLTGLNGTLIFNEDRLQVEKLTATTGGGLLTLGGSIRYRGGLFADLSATGNAVRVRYNGLSTTANANLKLQGGPQNALLSGSIVITRFGIGPDVDFAAFAGSTGGVSAPPDPNAASSKIRLDVHVTSSPQLDFQNSYAKLAGTVDLTLRGTVAEPTVLGRIQITDGSATFAGTKYQLQRGDIYFTNPVRIDPVIDLDATARVENYDVTVGLHGTANNLKPTFRSEPPLSEADVFALLALGRTQEEAQLYQEQQVQMGTDPTTSSLLGGALNATVSNRVEKLFGVGSVKIDPAFVGTLGGSSARITVQQQLSRQLTATYATNVNTQAEQLIQLQYDISHNVSILATRDETGVFSVVYKIRRRYR